MDNVRPSATIIVGSLLPIVAAWGLLSLFYWRLRVEPLTDFYSSGASRVLATTRPHLITPTHFLVDLDAQRSPPRGRDAEGPDEDSEDSDDVAEEAMRGMSRVDRRRSRAAFGRFTAHISAVPGVLDENREGIEGAHGDSAVADAAAAFQVHQSRLDAAAPGGFSPRVQNPFSDELWRPTLGFFDSPARAASRRDRERHRAAEALRRFERERAHAATTNQQLGHQDVAIATRGLSSPLLGPLSIPILGGGETAAQSNAASLTSGHASSIFNFHLERSRGNAEWCDDSPVTK